MNYGPQMGWFRLNYPIYGHDYPLFHRFPPNDHGFASRLGASRSAALRAAARVIVSAVQWAVWLFGT